MTAYEVPLSERDLAYVRSHVKRDMVAVEGRTDHESASKRTYLTGLLDHLQQFGDQTVREIRAAQIQVVSPGPVRCTRCGHGHLAHVGGRCSRSVLVDLAPLPDGSEPYRLDPCGCTEFVNEADYG